MLSSITILSLFATTVLAGATKQPWALEIAPQFYSKVDTFIKDNLNKKGVKDIIINGANEEGEYSVYSIKQGSWPLRIGIMSAKNSNEACKELYKDTKVDDTEISEYVKSCCSKDAKYMGGLAAFTFGCQLDEKKFMSSANPSPEPSKKPHKLALWKTKAKSTDEAQRKWKKVNNLFMNNEEAKAGHGNWKAVCPYFNQVVQVIHNQAWCITNPADGEELGECFSGSGESPCIKLKNSGKESDKEDEGGEEGDDIGEEVGGGSGRHRTLVPDVNMVTVYLDTAGSSHMVHSMDWGSP